MMFDLNTNDGLERAEKYKTKIENKGKKPIIKTIGFDKIEILED